jgi:hypothetical protein
MPSESCSAPVTQATLARLRSDSGSKRSGWWLGLAALVAPPLLGCAPKVAQPSVRTEVAVTPAPVTASAPSAASSSVAAAPLPDAPWRTPRSPHQEAALARDAAALTPLRATPPGNRLGCAQFRSLGLAAGLARRKAEGQDPVNECTEKATEVVACFETPAGLFVPVEQLDGVCSYRLWFVPRAPEQQAVPLTAVLEEFDIAFTLLLGPDDTNDDGVVEALLVRGWAHPEGVDESQEAHSLESNGVQRELPFSDFKDVDGDGRYDAVIDYSQLTNDGACSPPGEIEPWVAHSLASPPVVLHRLQGLHLLAARRGRTPGSRQALRELGHGCRGASPRRHRRRRNHAPHRVPPSRRRRSRSHQASTRGRLHARLCSAR